MAEKESKGTPQTQQTTQTPATTGGVQSPLMDLRRQMDRLFDEFTRGFPFGGLQPGGLMQPGAGAGIPDIFGAGMGAVPVNFEVSEGDKEIEITAEVPGMDENDINVEVSGGMLTVSGEKKSESEKSDKNVYMTERSYGSFRRRFRLPETVDDQKIDATFEKGVLKISMPKKAEAQSDTRKINVKSSK